MSPEIRHRDYTARKFFYGWVIALCCTLITIINGGIFFTFSVFFKPVALDFGWSRGEFAGSYTAMMVAYAPGAFFAGRLAGSRGPGAWPWPCRVEAAFQSGWHTYLKQSWSLGGGGGLLCSFWFEAQHRVALPFDGPGVSLQPEDGSISLRYGFSIPSLCQSISPVGKNPPLLARFKSPPLP